MRELVPRLRRERQLDLVVANGENMAGGSGLTGATAREILEAGVDVITTGDHVWDHKESAALLQEEQRVLRPLNYPAGAPGHGWVVIDLPGHSSLAVINLQGRTFLPPIEDPFRMAEEAIAQVRSRARAILVDFHAEATSEKAALAWMLDGRASAVIGTHTHVQTADEKILPGGTAFLSDAGFTGPHHSIIGRKIEPVLARFRTGMPQRFEVAKGDVRLQGALIDIDGATGRATGICRIDEPLSSRED